MPKSSREEIELEKRELPPDPKAEEKWRNMPQGAPSREALPPAAGGMRWVSRFLVALAVLVILVTLLSKSGLF